MSAPADRLINLNFHGIGSPRRTLHDGERQVWVSRARFLAILDAVADRADVRITFDDGNSSDVEDALPALLERGLTASFFVVAGRIGKPGFLDEAEVRALSTAGMRIGAHGMRHRPWSSIGESALSAELLECTRTLEQLAGHPVAAAACPFGSYDRRVLRALRRCGFVTVYTSDGGTARPGSWLQARNTVCAGDGPALVERIVSADRAPFRAIGARAKRAAKRWR